MGIFDFLKTSLLWPATGGGDGSSMEEAVVVNRRSSYDGICAEYGYISRFCGKKGVGYTLEMQVSQSRDGREYDLLSVKMMDGEMHEFWFDVTSFYGKF